MHYGAILGTAVHSLCKWYSQALRRLCVWYVISKKTPTQIITDHISATAPVLMPEVRLNGINRPARCHSAAAAGTGQGRAHRRLLCSLKWHVAQSVAFDLWTPQSWSWHKSIDRNRARHDTTSLSLHGIQYWRKVNASKQMWHYFGTFWAGFLSSKRHTKCQIFWKIPDEKDIVHDLLITD